MGHLSLTSGYSLILLFTYTGFLMVALVSRHYRGYFKMNAASLNKASITNTSMFGILFVLVYDLWTNLGAFLLMYPHTVNGFLLCYVLAVPFMLYHLISGAVTFALIVAPVTNVLQSRRSIEDPTPSITLVE